MFQLNLIKGVDFGIEYDEVEELGFVLCVSIGILRVVWYKDLIADDEE